MTGRFPDRNPQFATGSGKSLQFALAALKDHHKGVEENYHWTRYGLRQSEISPGKITANRIIDKLNDEESLHDAIESVDIPFHIFSDPYWEDHPDMYQFEVMLRSFIYAELRGIRYHNDLADFLDDNPDIAMTLGFEPDTPDAGPASLDAYQTPETPHQTTITRTANKRFKARTERFIKTVAEEVEEYCREHSHLIEMHELWSEDEDTNPAEPEDEMDPDGLTKQQIRRLVNELLRHVAPNITFKRGRTKTIRKNLFLEVLGHCALTNESVYGGGDVYDIYAKPHDEELPHGRTFYDHMEGLSIDEMLDMFDAAVESMVEAAREIGLYDRPVDLAIDVTTVEYTGLGKTFDYESIADPDADDLPDREAEEARTAIEKWDLEPIVGEDPADIKHQNFDDAEKLAAAQRVKDCVEWVNGTKDQDEDIEYGFQFAAGAFADKTCPLMFAVEPLSSRTAEDLEQHVTAFIERAQELVVVDIVFMDSYYAKSRVMNCFHYGHGFRTADKFDIEYVMKMPEGARARRQALEERYTDVAHTYEEGTDTTTICPEYAYGVDASRDSKKAHTTLVAVKNHNVDEVEDKVEDRILVATNRDHDDGEEMERFINRYTDRWTVENAFKESKNCLASTRTSKIRSRVFIFLLALLLYNIWMLIDRIAKKRLGKPFGGTPIIKFSVMVAAVIEALRPID